MTYEINHLMMAIVTRQKRTNAKVVNVLEHRQMLIPTSNRHNPRHMYISYLQCPNKLAGMLTSESQMRMVASSPAVMIVLLSGPQTALLILPLMPVITSADSSVSASTNTNASL